MPDLSKKSRFKRIYIEITNVCNLRCSFCSPTIRPSRFLSAEEFKHILLQVKPYTRYLALHVKGEPLMHPELSQILAYCKLHEMQVNLTTNGTLLTKNQELLLSCGAIRQVNLSVHSLPERLNRSEQSDLSDFITFARQAADRGIYTSFRLWNLQEGESHRTANAATLQIIEQLQQAFQPEFDLLAEMRYKRNTLLTNHIFVSWDESFEWPSVSLPLLSDRGFCHGGRDHLAILSDGTVVPCCLDADGIINLGNVLNTPMEQILTSDRFTDFYNGFSARKVIEPLCRHCSYRTRFDPTVSKV